MLNGLSFDASIAGLPCPRLALANWAICCAVCHQSDSRRASRAAVSSRRVRLSGSSPVMPTHSQMTAQVPE